MAASKCGSCGHGLFEMKVAEPKGSAVKMYFVQCGSCGAVAGTVEYISTSAMVVSISEAVEKVDKKLGTIDARLAQIEHILRQRG